METLPQWIPLETWTAYLAMRKQIKKPATEFAQKLLLKELYKIRDGGNDPVASLEQSIINCWTGVFVVKSLMTPQPANRQMESFRERDERLAAQKVAESSPRLARQLNPNPTFDYVDMEKRDAKPRLA